MKKTFFLFYLFTFSLSISACNDSFTQKEKVNLFPACPLVGEQFLCGYIDRSGKMVVPPQYERADPFRSGLAAVKQGGYTFYINEQGQPVNQRFSEGLAIAKLPYANGTAFGYVDTNGNVVIQPQFSHATSFSEGLAPVQFKTESGSSNYAYIDKSGKVVFKFEILEVPDSFHEGLAFVCFRSTKNCAFIDKQGKSVIQNLPSEQGYKNEHSLTVEPRHSRVGFSEGLAAICDYSGKLLPSGECGYIDKTGKVLVAPKIAGAGIIETLPFSEGLAPVGFDVGGEAKYGFVDRTGNFVIQPQFAFAEPFSGGLARVKIRSESQTYPTGYAVHDAYIDKKGSVFWDAFKHKVEPNKMQPDGRPLDGED